jgi:hypothetical protein
VSLYQLGSRLAVDCGFYRGTAEECRDFEAEQTHLQLRQPGVAEGYSFADVEFFAQGVSLEPTLKAISEFLDQHGHLVEKVRRDLERGLKNPRPDGTVLPHSR